jgi:hypothetical protein
MRVALFTLLVVGCNDDAQFTNACSGEYNQILGGLCDLLSRCPDLYPLAYSNREQCQAILCWASTCRIETQRNGNGIDFTLQETMPTVAAGSAQACLDYLQTVSCDKGLAANNPCGNVLGGSDNGNNNNGASECTSSACPMNSFCQYGAVDVDAGVRTCSTCQPKRKAGDSCMQAECEDGLYCDDHFNTSSFTCLQPQPDGSMCYSNATNHSPCQSGFCNFRTLLCDPAGHEGDACTSNYDCREGHCNSLMKCEALHAAGEPCTTDGDCANFTCDPNTHTCGLADGTACMQFGNRVCAGFCDSRTNLCASPKAMGEICDSDGQCRSLNCTQTSFSSSSRTCQVRCDDTTPCPSGQVCAGVFDYCTVPQPTGGTCQEDGDCASGHCGRNETCIDPPKIGGTCGDSSDCFPIGYCYSGTCQRQKSPGAACDAYDSCLAPYICLTGTCTLLNLTCKPAPAGSQCALLHVCDDQSYCDLGSNFTCKPRVGAGAMCGSDGQCEKTLYCLQGMCVTRLPAGSACTANPQCQDGNYCVMASSSSTGTCTAAPAGQPCDDFDAPCPDGWLCPDRVCVAGTAQKGQSCSFDVGCVAGLYCNGGMCQERQPIGQQCFDDNACLSGHCDRQVDLCLLSDMCM